MRKHLRRSGHLFHGRIKYRPALHRKLPLPAVVLARFRAAVHFGAVLQCCRATPRDISLHPLTSSVIRPELYVQSAGERAQWDAFAMAMRLFDVQLIATGID